MPTYAGSRPPRRSLYRGLPVWAQWGIPFALAGGLIVALVIWVHYETNSVPSEAGVNNPRAILEQNRDARILIGQEQAPHVAKLARTFDTAASTRAAVLAFMTGQIRRNVISGTLEGAHCRPAGGTSNRRLVSCTAFAGHVNYPFRAVATPARGTVTFCRSVPPPIPSMKIPVSRRCT